MKINAYLSQIVKEVYESFSIIIAPSLCAFAHKRGLGLQDRVLKSSPKAHHLNPQKACGCNGSRNGSARNGPTFMPLLQRWLLLLRVASQS